MCPDEAGIRMFRGPRLSFNRGFKATIPWHAGYRYV
jgi:hypothetical protein